MFLVVGLGNPGAEYANTRHNIGFMATDEIFSRCNVSAFKSKFDALVAEGQIAGEKVLLVKPLTYMNLSGNCVGELVNFYKLSPQNVIVIHDDMDLPVGKIEAKGGGGAGGHNGLKSIDAAVSPNYNRIRIGVGHPIGDAETVVHHVLSGFGKEDKKILDEETALIVKTIGILLKKGIGDYSGQLGMLQKK